MITFHFKIYINRRSVKRARLTIHDSECENFKVTNSQIRKTEQRNFQHFKESEEPRPAKSRPAKPEKWCPSGELHRNRPHLQSTLEHLERALQIEIFFRGWLRMVDIRVSKRMWVVVRIRRVVRNHRLLLGGVPFD